VAYECLLLRKYLLHNALRVVHDITTTTTNTAEAEVEKKKEEK
jgi:hypothetical protein